MNPLTAPATGPMSIAGLADDLPDLAIDVSRVGVLRAYVGGHGTGLVPEPDSLGRDLETCWPLPVARAVKQLIRRAIRARSPSEARVGDAARAWEVRVTPRGPDRAICMIRLLAEPPAPESAEDGSPGACFGRQQFLERFRAAVESARLREQPLAVAVIQLDAVGDIARIVNASVAEQVTQAALERLRRAPQDAGVERSRWFVGKLADDSVALAIECGERPAIEAQVEGICRSLREPVAVGDASFQLSPQAGVALLGTDADSPNALLRRARAAADEARRAGRGQIGFFSDTLQLRSLARLDLARELGAAIESGTIGLRYAGRHDLASGRRVAWVGYLQWIHALRGEVRPAEFVNIAQATGQAEALSRAVLACLRRDFLRLMRDEPADVRISFGALRQHVLHADFRRDIEALVESGDVPAERLELRIAERSLLACDVANWRLLSDRGIRLVVDEVGREMSSLDRLARVPLWGLQLDRSWASALCRDPVALRVCGAGIGVATSLGLIPIATGVDAAAQRDLLRTLGCTQAMGDLYPGAPPASPTVTATATATSTARMKA